MELSCENTNLYKLLKEKNSPFLKQVEDIDKHARNILPKINRVFANYTGHGIEHSINVMHYMYELIPEPKLFSDLEIVGLIYSAFLHDVGMVVTEDEILKIKSDDLTIVDKRYSLVFEKYQDEIISLQECIRPIHGIRSKTYIENEVDSDLFLLPGSTNISFKEDIAKICAAHNENFEWIMVNLQNDSVKGSYQLNCQFLALLLRIADSLDIDEGRAPLYLYKYLKPKEFGDIEWRKHFIIENKDKIVLNEKTGFKHIEFYGSSENANIHRKLLKYFDSINGELKNAVDLSESFHEPKYVLLLKTNIENKIRTKGFNFSDFKLTLDYNAVTNLLMGEHIYGDKKYGLRELIQNSIDACKVMLEESEGKGEFLYSPYQPFINIILDQDRKQVVIIDNGRGMSLDILKKYFLNVGVSYYISEDYLLRGPNYKPIGAYGIGFLSCFMLSDEVIVNTKFYGETKLNRIEFEKDSEYICLTFEENSRLQGTEIVLNYDQFMSVFKNDPNIIKTFVESNFLDCGVPINILRVEDGESTPSKCNLKDIVEQDNYNIILDEYLNDITGNIEANYKSINFFENLIEFNGDISYIYDVSSGELIEESESRINLKTFIRNGIIDFLSIPIIESSYAARFRQAFDVLDNFDEALEKIDYYDKVNIICKDTWLYYGHGMIRDDDDRIIDQFEFSDFCRLFPHDSSNPTFTYSISQKVIQTTGNKILPYSTDKYIGGKYSFSSEDKLYLRNVLISQAKLKIPFLADGMQIKKAYLNIMNKNFIPNVSRNNLSESLKQDLSYAIGKALHLWIIDHGNLSPEETELLKAFVQECYSTDNYCLKSNKKN